MQKKLLIFLILIFVFINGYTQKKQDSIIINRLIKSEIMLNYEISNKNLTQLALSEANLNNFDIIEIRRLSNSSKFKELSLIKTKIEYEYNSIYLKNLNNQSFDTLEFHIVEHLGNYYRLFGFTFSDIRSLEIENYKLLDFIIKNQILSKPNARKFLKLYNSTNVTLIPVSFNYPPQMIGMFYPNNPISSIMLPTQIYRGLRI